MSASLDFYAGMHSGADLSQRENYCEYLQSKAKIEYGAALINRGLERQATIISEEMEREAERREYIMRDIAYRQEDETRRAAQMQSEAITSAARIQSRALEESTRKRVEAINALSASIGCNLKAIGRTAELINQKLAISNEQKILTNAKLDNIIELMKIPDSEKERQKSITLGIKFFINASKNPELLHDSLEEFLKAETLQKQDYFVLHRIGCIYLYDPAHLDISLGRDYFLRAAKYASADCDPNAVLVANALVNRVNKEYSDLKQNKNAIQMLAADSFSKAAFASYVLEEIHEAVDLQRKACILDSAPNHSFVLAKYLIADGQEKQAMDILSDVIDKDPSYESAALFIGEFVNNDNVMNMVNRKDLELNAALDAKLVNCSRKDAKKLYLAIEKCKTYMEKHELLASLA